MKNSNIHNNFLNVQKKNSIIKKQKILVLFNYIIKKKINQITFFILFLIFLISLLIVLSLQFSSIAIFVILYSFILYSNILSWNSFYSIKISNFLCSCFLSNSAYVIKNIHQVSNSSKPHSQNN